MQHDTISLQTVSARAHNLCYVLIERITEWHMAHNPSFKERKWANTLGAINNLIRHHKIPRLNNFLQTTHSRERNYGPDTDTSQSCNVGAVGYLMRRDLVVSAVTAEECDGHVFAGDAALVMDDCDGGGGLAPGSLDVERGDLGEAGEVLEAGSADDRNADLVFNVVREGI
jgi:hypothetical protein